MFRLNILFSCELSVYSLTLKTLDAIKSGFLSFRFILHFFLLYFLLGDPCALAVRTVEAVTVRAVETTRSITVAQTSICTCTCTTPEVFRSDRQLPCS
jgi:hypothetical protein